MKQALFALMVFSWAFANGQTDSVLLNQVTVEGFAYIPYNTGAPVKELSLEGSRSLANALESEPSIYLKTYGNHQLTTVSFRGTTASHTNVLWHGIPVNSPTLGQTDFSTWPTWLMDDLAVLPGSAGAMFGSGSIGGTVFIDHFDNYPKKQTTLQLKVGSFGEYFGGAKSTYGFGNFTGSTALFYSSIENNFSYPLKGTDETQTQQNAGVINFGAKQKLQWRWKSSRLSFDFMATHMDREAQPSITNNTAEDELVLSNLRGASELLIGLAHGTLTSTIGWVQDDLTYNDLAPTITNQFTILEQYELSLEKINIQTGLNGNQAYATSENFAEENQQSNLDVFFLATISLKNNWQLSPDLRQSFYSGGYAPFVPSLAIGKKWDQESFTQKLTVKGSRGFRYPTLNDRFWTPGGNPDLTPETNMSTEIQSSSRWNSWSVNITGFATWAENWILWSPVEGGIWSPENLQDVHIRGAEANITWKKAFQNLAFKSTLGANWQQSLNRSEYPTSEAKNNQLPYVPMLSFNWFNKISSEKWSAGINQSFTGKRYTTLDNEDFQSVESFYLIDVFGTYHLDLGGISSDVRLDVRNITNRYYENLKNRAMPGINYQFQLTINI